MKNILLQTTSLRKRFVFLFLLGIAPLAQAEAFRPFKDIYGREFEASVVSVTPVSVRLKNAAGKEIDFQINLLSPQDQTYVRAWKPTGPVPESTEFMKTFEKDLVIVEGKSASSFDQPLGQVKYFAFYKSASWCPPCRKFTPDLVKFYNRMKEKHPEFELIFVSSDRSGKDMEAYMADYKMPWPAFKHGKHKGLVRSKGNGIPCLVVTDAHGNVLHDSYTDQGDYRGPSAVLKDLEKLLGNS
jgi:nucleoredoxin